MTLKKYFVPGVLALCVLISLVMAVFKPLPHGHRYDLEIKLSLALAIFYLFTRVRPEWTIKKTVLVLAFAAGVGLGIGEIATIDPHAEVIRVYESVFTAIRNQQNPYTTGTIFHFAEYRKPVYGDFNYPPAEIYPYYLAYRLTGVWNSTVFTSVLIILHALVCLIFLWTFPDIRRGYLVPFFTLFLFTEIITNPAMTFFVTALTLLVIKKNMEAPWRGYRWLIAVLFGVGLMTKFLIIPLMAAYYWHKVDLKKPSTILNIVPDVAVSLGTAVVIMAPYGVGAVLKNTILFNLILKDRAVFTTFYPNVLSGPMSLLGLGGLYPIVAVLILVSAVFVAPKLSLTSALMTAAFAFLFVTATPEPQYVPVMLYLSLYAIFLKMERTDPLILRRRQEVPA